MKYFEEGLLRIQELVGGIRAIFANFRDSTSPVEITNFIQKESVQQTDMVISDTTRKAAIIIATGFVVTEFIWQLYKRRWDAQKDATITEVLFFSEESALCRAHANTRVPCNRFYCSVTNLKKILAYMDSSKKTLDVCIYFLTCLDLAMCIARAHKRNVVVRVIVDADMADNNSSQSQIVMFRRLGIKVRMKRSIFLMHHKFVIVDKNILLTGSANWTMQAMYGNFDNVIISNQKALTKPFIAEFERLWTVLNVKESRKPEGISNAISL